MSEVPIFPTGLYWIRITGRSIVERDAEYAALWLFPTGNFRYIACWPGYSWFDASGTWLYGMGLIHCQGKSHYFSERIRRSGIDCPGKGQAFGNRAKQAMSALVFGKGVIIQTHGQDKHGRTIADVLLPGGVHVNHELVKDGWCWWSQNFLPEDLVFGSVGARS